MSVFEAGRVEIHGTGNVVGDNNTVNINSTLPLAVTSLHQLPPPPRDFVGREVELRDLRETMASGGGAISSIVGMGGVGKTSLALKLAAEIETHYADAALYIDLKGIEAEPLSVAEALQSFIHAFEPTAALPSDVAQLQGIYRTLLHNKRALVVLDNAKDSAQIEPLLPPASCGVIVTSRQHFTVPGLKLTRLAKLPPDEAYALLLKIAPRIGDCAAEMARVLDYLPLALRLAASALAQRENLTPSAYVKSLSDATKRVELMLAPLQLSYNMLGYALRVRWRALAVFCDSFTDMAASHVWEINQDAANEALGEFLSWSMVEWNDATGRYRLHDIARDFASVRLHDGVKEGRAVYLRHATYFWRALRCMQKMCGGAILLGLKLFDDDRANIESGQLWAHSNAAGDEDAARLCMKYPLDGPGILDLRFPASKRIAWLEAALAVAQALKERQQEADTLCSLGVAYEESGDTWRAFEFHKHHLEIAREIGDQRGESVALGNMGLSYSHWGRPDLAIEPYEQALQLIQKTNDRRTEATTLNNIGSAYMALGETRRAIGYFEQSLEIGFSFGNQLDIAPPCVNLASAYADLGRPQAAVRLYEIALGILHDVGDRHGEAQTLAHLGAAHSDLGNPQLAIEYYERSLRLTLEIGDPRGEGNVLWNMSLELDKLGNREQAMELAANALAIYEHLDHPNAIRIRSKLDEWREATV